MGQLDFISSIFVRFLDYLGCISLNTRYECIGLSVRTVCAFYPDSQTVRVETLRSACIFMCRSVMMSLSKAFSGK